MLPQSAQCHYLYRHLLEWGQINAWLWLIQLWDTEDFDVALEIIMTPMIFLIFWHFQDSVAQNT